MQHTFLVVAILVAAILVLPKQKQFTGSDDICIAPKYSVSLSTQVPKLPSKTKYYLQHKVY